MGITCIRQSPTDINKNKVINRQGNISESSIQKTFKDSYTIPINYLLPDNLYDDSITAAQIKLKKTFDIFIEQKHKVHLVYKKAQELTYTSKKLVPFCVTEDIYDKWKIKLDSWFINEPEKIITAMHAWQQAESAWNELGPLLIIYNRVLQDYIAIKKHIFCALRTRAIFKATIKQR